MSQLLVKGLEKTTPNFDWIQRPSFFEEWSRFAGQISACGSFLDHSLKMPPLWILRKPPTRYNPYMGFCTFHWRSGCPFFLFIDFLTSRLIHLNCDKIFSYMFWLSKRAISKGRKWQQAKKGVKIWIFSSNLQATLGSAFETIFKRNFSCSDIGPP